ncbi:MAG: SGNH/GDSL hydrolase family protein, partial [Ruminococcus sp.]|nr:SGNH/GDSL hydrolase family protein [Ruminococcus sp.]
IEKIEQKQTNDFIRKKIKALNSSIETHRNDENAEYMVADVYSDFYGKANELTRINDMDIHPNQKGHDAISKCVDKTIRMERYTYNTKAKDTAAQSNSIKERDNTTEIAIAISVFAALVAIIIAIVIRAKKQKH